MALCPDPTGTAIIGGDGVFISGSGTPGDPWVINLVEPVDVADLQADVADLQASMLTLPTTYVAASGDSMTGALRITSTGQGLYLTRSDSDSSHLGFYNSTGATRQAYLLSSGSGFDIFDNQGYVRLLAAGSEVVRVTEPNVFMHKTASDVATQGMEFAQGGQMQATRTTTGINLYLNKVGAANVDGQVYASFRQAGTQIGRIERASVTSATYTAASDQALKENIESIDDELALLWMRVVEPVFYEAVGDVEHRRQVGYIAQDAEALWPNGCTTGVISHGHGDPADRTWDEDGNETTPDEVWTPYGFAYERAGVHLHASARALDRIIAAQAETISGLRTEVTDLEARLAAVEAIVKPK